MRRTMGLEVQKMVGLLKRETKPVDRFDRLDHMFDEWSKSLPMRWPALFGRDWPEKEMIRVDEYREDGALVIRAELPGVDPDEDIELTVSDGMLHIEAERREEGKVEEKGYLRRELRTGSFMRTLPLPEGVSESDVKASYADGILEIRVPMLEPEQAPVTKIEITKS